MAMEMPTSEDHAFAKALARVMGWLYFFLWSASFYPQAITNWRRKRTEGFTVGYAILNVIGFVAYSCSTGAFMFDPLVRWQYASRHPENPENSVQINDFAFAIHALILCVIQYTQFWPKLWGFRVTKIERASRAVLGLCYGSFAGVLILVIIVFAKSKDWGVDPYGWAWIDVVYGVGYVKLYGTVAKYIPQVISNYQRKSTAGFDIAQIQLDFWGGIAADLQQIIESSLESDWSGITGNSTKFGLSNVSILFDTILLVQHHIVYRKNTLAEERADREAEATERTPLIGAET